MASIDWSKPLRTIPSGFPVTAAEIDEYGTRSCTWKQPGYFRGASVPVDSSGRLIVGVVFGDGVLSPAGTQVVENAPELFRVSAVRLNGSRWEGPAHSREDILKSAAYLIRTGYFDSVAIEQVS